MKHILIKKNGKFNEDIKEIFRNLFDGKYIISLDNITNRNENSLRLEYFRLVDVVNKYTGQDKDEIHQIFKEFLSIDSTASFSIIEWEDFISKFKDYIFSKLDILL